jgi:nucleoid DNA-binding protein
MAKKASKKVAKKTTKKAAKKATTKSVKEAAGPLTKAGLVEAIADVLGEDVTKKQVKGVLETMCELGYAQLNKHGSFVVPGFAKFVVVKKKATKARKGINPFTGEETVFKAKPARKAVKARPVKAAKDAVA